MSRGCGLGVGVKVIDLLKLSIQDAYIALPRIQIKLNARHVKRTLSVEVVMDKTLD